MKTRGEGHAFDTAAENLSAGGLYASSPRALEIGARCRFHICLCLAGTDPDEAPEAFACGKIVRSEKLPEGSVYFAAEFTRYRML
jgi:hypothetical protein